MTRDGWPGYLGPKRTSGRGTVIGGIFALLGLFVLWAALTIASIAVPVVIVVLILRAMGVL